MTKTKHTPEPWRASTAEGDHGGIIGADGCSPATAHGWCVDSTLAIRARVISCVNACAGINPEAVPDLLAACKAMLNTPAMNADEMDPIEIEAVELARAAIAKAEGRE